MKLDTREILPRMRGLLTDVIDIMAGKTGASQLVSLAAYNDSTIEMLVWDPSVANAMAANYKEQNIADNHRVKVYMEGDNRLVIEAIEGEE